MDRKVRFCDAELGQIRNRTMRDIMCENTDLAEITPDPFKSPEFAGNEVLPCTRFNPLEPADEECVSGTVNEDISDRFRDRVTKRSVSEENDYDRFVPTSDFSDPGKNAVDGKPR